jgi:hypothetical protein
MAISRQLESELRRIYLPMLEGVGIRGGQARQWMRVARDACRGEPELLGQLILREQGLPGFGRIVELARADGATDVDIANWYDLHEYEKHLIVKFDELCRMALFLDRLEKGAATPDAAADVRRAHPMYGDLLDTSNTTGDDRPLPYALKGRVNRYIEKQANNLAAYRQRRDEYSTFNALVRAEVRQGRL